MSSLILRQISEADEPFLREMLYLAIYIPEGSPRPPESIVNSPELARYVSDWGRPDDLGFIAVDGISHQPLGAVWLRLLNGENKGYGYIDEATPELSIAVLPDFRGRGVGTQLMNRLLEEAGNKYENISLSVSEENPALRLYRRLGFEIDSRDGTSVRMKKRVKAGGCHKTWHRE